MKKSIQALCAIAGIVLLAGCETTSMEYDSASKIQPAGNPFTKALFNEYLTLSKSSMDVGDVKASNAFALNAKMAGQGAEVQPEEVAAHKLAPGDAQTIAQSRNTLMAALATARQGAPGDAARAQALFDCWVVQAETRTRPADLQRCHEGFEQSLAKIRNVAAAVPRPPQKFVVYFERNSTALSSAANEVVAHAIAAAKDAKSIDVVGYTDTSGSARYNFKLSAKRADAVVGAMVKAGVAAPRISQASMGENNPAVPTKDNVREIRNRRVEITVTH